MASFSSRLRELRKKSDMRQKDLANALGLGQTTIANYEQGTRFPDEEILHRFADYFDTSLDYLLGRVDFDTSPRTMVPHSMENSESRLPLIPLAENYLERLLAGDREGATELILENVREGVNVPGIYMEVFQPVLKEVGRLWSRREVEVAVEHFVSTVTESIMSQIIPLAPHSEPNGLTVIGMTVCGELHEIGIRMVTDFFKMNGWKAYYLGTGICSRDVVRAVERYQPDLLALSVTMDQHVNMLNYFIEGVRSAQVDKKLKIIAGGPPLRSNPKLVEQYGIDATAHDARSAVRVASALF